MTVEHETVNAPCLWSGVAIDGPQIGSWGSGTGLVYIGENDLRKAVVSDASIVRKAG